MQLYLEFDRLVRALVAAKARFAVAGGIAVGLHGFVRATKDIDLLALPPHLEKVRRVLLDAGYRENPTQVSFPNSGLTLCRFFRRAPSGEDLFVVDVLLAESPATAAILRRVSRMRYADLRIPVVSAADLVRMKRQRGSKLDEADIEKLSKRHAKKADPKNQS